MESLLMEADADNTMDLNIVCNAAAASVSDRRRKPKKRNKYEKRREKARRAREAARKPEKSLTRNEATSNTTRTNDTNLIKEMVKANVHEDGEDTAASSAEEEQETSTFSRITSDDHDDKDESTLIKQDDSLHSHETDSPLVEEQVPMQQKLPASRRVHSLRLENTLERARYLAEFHARPMEMDRRSGAVRTEPRSKDSNHLFLEKEEWNSFQLHPRIASFLGKQHPQGPTVIQSRAIPLLNNNTAHHVFCQSETGSGKTLAYLIPILQSLAPDSASMDRKSLGTRCIVLCPTRELANQIFQTCELLCRSTFSVVVSGCLSGGERRKSEKARIRKGLNIIIATPGRLLDHFKKTECLMESVAKLEWLVLDEADRLLDMGLGNQVEQAVQLMEEGAGAKTWRCVCVSATVTDRVQELARGIVRDGSQEWQWASGTNSKVVEKDDCSTLANSTPRQLTQMHMTVSAKLRLTALVAFLVQRVLNKERTVVFLSTCDSVDYHHALFCAADSILQKDENGIFGKSCPIYKLHGSIPHGERQVTLRKFNAAESSILLSTDVAARGLNIDVDWILQYDAPCEVADYVHRAGRTARAGKAGRSLLFVLPSEKPFLDVLEQQGMQKMTALSLSSTLDRAAEACRESCDLQSSQRMGEAFCFEVQRRLENAVLQDDAQHQEALKKAKRSRNKPSAGPLLEMARSAYVSYIRAYPTKEKSVRHIFSARAMHLGHVARSFALKEPPKSLAKSREKQDKKNDEVGKKRHASLAFEQNSSNVTNKKKSQKTRRSQSVSTDDHNNMDPKRNRSMLLARAQQLQNGGMDAF